MALQNGYGVLIGRLIGFHRDLPDRQGRWFHDNLEIAAAGQTYWATVDVASRQSASGVQWKVLDAAAAEMGPVPVGSDGFNRLRQAPRSGCLDHVRHTVTANPRTVRPTLWGLIPLRPVTRPNPWTAGSPAEAASALESILTAGSTVLVWGEPFTSHGSHGQGIHNVHQNQGDPIGSPWWEENAVWQDGGVATVGSDGRFRLFVTRFASQVDRTDAWGHPA